MAVLKLTRSVYIARIKTTAAAVKHLLLLLLLPLLLPLLPLLLLLLLLLLPYCCCWWCCHCWPSWSSGCSRWHWDCSCPVDNLVRELPLLTTASDDRCFFLNAATTDLVSEKFFQLFLLSILFAAAASVAAYDAAVVAAVVAAPAPVAAAELNVCSSISLNV